jgi:protein-S-isoprenylcysteine O-methyltransferase Ste14
MAEAPPVTPQREHSGVVFPPPLIYLLFFLAALALERYVPLPPPPAGLSRALGALFVLAALALVVASIRRFRAVGTSLVPVRPSTALVVAGPYRFTRNPMYLGLLLLYAGLAGVFVLVWPLLLGPLLVWVVGEWVIGPEERYLAEKFGEEYHLYRERVRRWV